MTTHTSNAAGPGHPPRAKRATTPDPVRWSPGSPPPARVDGGLPISAYAAIGDGRTGGLVGLDGSVDWLCLPELSSRPILARLLDEGRGGRCALAPEEPFTVTRQYLPGTNVLRTRFTTVDGCADVTDAIAIDVAWPDSPPMLLRRIEAVRGRIRLAWRMAPRFGEGASAPDSTEPWPNGLCLHGDGQVISLVAWGCGDPSAVDDGLEGTFDGREGHSALLLLSSGTRAPERPAAEAALDAAVAIDRRWSSALRRDPNWPDQVERSVLALHLLTHRPTGAPVAALTTSLPEKPGGTLNWDYRACWLRDASFTMDAFTDLGDHAAAQRFLAWLENHMGDAGIQPCYQLDGGAELPEREVDLAGYRGAQPVRVGNRAAGQRQLSSYGDVMQSCAISCRSGAALTPRLADRLARQMTRLAETWRLRDAGIWESVDERAHTWSRMACWVALDGALTLASEGRIPGGERERWRAARDEIREQIESHHFDEELGAYTAADDGDDLDAGVILGVLMGYPAPIDRWNRTLDTLRERLGRGPLMYRTTVGPEAELTFLPCSFWTVGALARLGREREATEMMEALLPYANDVGLFSEEATEEGELWGNTPQALTHGALIGAAKEIARARAAAD